MGDKYGTKRESADAMVGPGPAPARFVDIGGGAYAEAFAPVDASGNVNPLPTGAATEATLATRLSESDFDTKVGSTTDPAVKSAAATGALSAKLRGLVEMFFDVWNSTLHFLNINVKQASAATLSSVASSASNVTVIASNANRRGALIFNDADKVLYLKFGATASATSFTVQIAAGGYYEFPAPLYTGIVDGIWATGPTGSARVTELT